MDCLNNNELKQFCELVGANQGKNAQESCKNIISKIKKKPACIKSVDLIELAEKLGVQSTGTKKDIIARLGKNLKTPFLVPEDVETKIVQSSIKKNIKEEQTTGCLVYKDDFKNIRHLTVVSIPKDNFNKKNQWLPSGRYMNWNTCQKCAFYLSTGTSNEGKNFPGMWFPFMRVQERSGGTMPRGWLDKSYGLEGTSINNPSDVLKMLNKKFDVKITDFLMVFFEKFSHWWQVSISASLPSAPDSMWNTHAELRFIRDIALAYVFDNFSGFVKSEKIIQKYIVPECVTKADSPEEINSWLLKNNALCYDKDRY